MINDPLGIIWLRKFGSGVAHAFMNKDSELTLSFCGRKFNFENMSADMNPNGYDGVTVVKECNSCRICGNFLPQNK